MNTTLVPRHFDENSYRTLYFDRQGKTVSISMEEFHQKFNVDGVIRIPKQEFDLITDQMKRFTHFNIQYCAHNEGEKYVILKIDQPGFFDGTNERQPIFNNEIYLETKCVRVKNYIPYEELKDSDFQYSLSHIYDVASLKKAILKRYEQSLAHVSDDQKLALGVSITELEITRRSYRELI
jgi:hypothetical protein